MLTALIKHLLSSLRGRVGGLLELARKGWDAIRQVFRNGIRSLLVPPLDAEQRASIDRLQARAEAVLRERAEQERRAAAAEQAKRAAAERAAAAAGKGAQSAAASSAETAGPPTPIVLPGADQTTRVAEVLKVVAPVAVRALVQALGPRRSRRRRLEASPA